MNSIGSLNTPISAPAGQTFIPQQASYSDRGHEIADSSVIYFSRISCTQEEATARQLNNMNIMAQDPKTTDTEKFLATVGKSMGEAGVNLEESALIRNFALNAVLSQTPGPLAGVLASFADQLAGYQYIGTDTKAAALGKGIDAVLQSPAFSADQKELAELGKVISPYSQGGKVKTATESRILQEIATPSSTPVNRRMAGICSEIANDENMHWPIGVDLLGEGLKLIKDHPNTTPQEAALASFGINAPEKVTRDIPAIFLRSEVADYIARGAATRPEIDMLNICSATLDKPKTMWSPGVEVIIYTFQSVQAEPATTADNQILTKLGLEVLSPTTCSPDTFNFTKRLVSEMAADSDKNVAEKMYDVCKDTMTGSSMLYEKSRFILTLCFKTLQESELPPEFKGLENYIAEGFELGKTGKDDKETIQKQLDLLGKFSGISVMRKEMENLQDSLNGGQDANIQVKDSEVDVDGIVLKKKKRWLNMGSI